MARRSTYRRIAGRCRAWWNDCRGAAIVEFTVAAPLLVALGIGVGEFGRALQHHHVVNKAMRDAGRFLARVPVDCSGGAGSTGSISLAGEVTKAKNLAMNGEITGGSARISYWTDPNTIAVAIDCTNRGTTLRSTFPGDPDVLPVIQVTATVPYQDLGFLSALGLGGITFTVRHQQVHIGE